jgi:hypothetical protein
MPVERISIVSVQEPSVDERGTEGLGTTSPALYLDLALRTYDRETKVRGPRSKLIRADRDGGASVSRINPDLLGRAFCITIKWIRADRKLLSASNHDMQGIGSDVMTVMITSFPDGHGGWTDLLEKLCVYTTIPYGVLVGRPLIKNPAFGRHGDSAQGIQRFGPYSSPLMPAPER